MVPPASYPCGSRRRHADGCGVIEADGSGKGCTKSAKDRPFLAIVIRKRKDGRWRRCGACLSRPARVVGVTGRWDRARVPPARRAFRTADAARVTFLCWPKEK